MQQRFFDHQLRRALLGGIFTMFAATVALAQTAPHYVGLTYYQTLPGKATDFRKFAETEMVKMGQSGVDEGNIDAYYILRLTAPYSAGSEFNYAQIVWYKNPPSLAPLDMKLWDARAKKAGFASYQQYLDKRDSMAKTVKTLWRTSTARIGEVRAGNYMRSVNYQVDPDYRTQMAQFLQDYTMPIAQYRMSAGNERGWGVTRPATAIMSDDEAGYSFSVSVVWKDAEVLMTGPGALTEEAFKKAVPGKTYAAYMAQLNLLNAHRKAVMTRIYEVVTVAGAPPKITP